jgi:uncharacterized protein YbjT (DUF2867 family)
MAGNGKRVLVLGAYGFIGAEVVRALQAADCAVTGLGRNPEQAARVLPGLPFVSADLRQLTQVGDWGALLHDVDVVVNCAGVLQDMAPGELEAVHHTAIAALAQASMARDIAVVQISAVGAGPQASTEFMRSKGRGDAALRGSGVRAYVLRPGLVIGQGAFGGTLLLRMLAAVPLVQPVALSQALIQSVNMQDVAAAVVQAVQGSLPTGRYDLVEDQPHTLEALLVTKRSWLGFADAKTVLHLPQALLPLVAACADGLGRLGWRSPLRSTAIAAIRDGVRGDPAPYRAATGQSLAALPETLASLPVGREQRLDARMALLMPLTVAMLSLFWLASGGIGLWQVDAAAGLLQEAGWSAPAATASVVFWSGVDIALGLAILWRRWAERACLGMVLVSLIYLGAASLVTPALWADPLGPLVKVLPGALLALLCCSLLEER